jgi:hypothetical protein
MKLLANPLSAIKHALSGWLYGTPGYQVVKTILEKGLDQLTLLTAFDALAATYTEGGRFCRDTQTILQ